MRLYCLHFLAEKTGRERVIKKKKKRYSRGSLRPCSLTVTPAFTTTGSVPSTPVLSYENDALVHKAHFSSNNSVKEIR